MKDGNSAKGMPTSTPSSFVKSSRAGSYLLRSKPALSASGLMSAQAPWKLARPSLPTGPTMSGALPPAIRALSASYELEPLLATTFRITQASFWDLLYLSTQAVSSGITGASVPPPRPTYQVILVAFGSQPSPPVRTGGGMVGLGTAVGAWVAPAAGVAVAAATAVAV